MPKTISTICNENVQLSSMPIKECTANELLYTQDEVDSLLHQKWMDTIHEMQRAGELKRKAVYDFIDAIGSQTNNWDTLCDCGTSEYDIMGELHHSNDCMTMNARHDAEQLLKKFEDRI